MSDSTLEKIQAIGLAMLLAAIALSFSGCKSAPVSDTVKQIDAVIDSGVLDKDKPTKTDRSTIKKAVLDSRAAVVIAENKAVVAEAKEKAAEKWSIYGKISFAGSIAAVGLMFIFILKKLLS